MILSSTIYTLSTDWDLEPKGQISDRQTSAIRHVQNRRLFKHNIYCNVYKGKVAFQPAVVHQRHIALSAMGTLRLDAV